MFANIKDKIHIWSVECLKYSDAAISSLCLGC